MIHIEPLGTGVILPAFVVGYELPFPVANPDHLIDLPGWIVTLDQQAGGMAMSYPSVIGTVLRLEANQEKGKQDLARLIRGLKYMAQDPRVGILKRDYPVLSKVVATWGTEYTNAELAELGNFLSSYLTMPPLQGGIEAFVRCAACDPLDYFKGWRKLHCSVRAGDSRRGSVYTLDKEHCYYVDDSNVSDLILTDEGEFDRESVENLVQLAHNCGRHSPAEVFLLWENAD